ncbi:MAG: hypothetical protein Q9201_003730 [Fulgogasparrea decipioides]
MEVLKKLLNVEPADYKQAWTQLKEHVLNSTEHVKQITSLAPRTLSAYEAIEIFNLTEAKGFLWESNNVVPTPQYLTENISRIQAVTSPKHQANEAFSRTIMDQILLSAIYEENQSQAESQQSSQHEDAAVLELHHETLLQMHVAYSGETRLLNGYADYTVWYDSAGKGSLATNLIIVEAKKLEGTDTCLGQLIAYMGVIHAVRKDDKKHNPTVYGVASGGLMFRFLRIDNDSNLSSSRLLEWESGDAGKIYTIFRTLIRIAALSSPSKSPIKNPQQRERVLASFGSPDRARNFDFDLSALVLLEEDEDTEIVGS